mmetsp:Transcript_19994/g.44652  ORF Transcript_19994/g.44652 Transcript_19994/m.44652 type:complete len:228 (-) Transcript_19994:192-875(-)
MRGSNVLVPKCGEALNPRQSCCELLLHVVHLVLLLRHAHRDAAPRSHHLLQPLLLLIKARVVKAYLSAVKLRLLGSLLVEDSAPALFLHLLLLLLCPPNGQRLLLALPLPLLPLPLIREHDRIHSRLLCHMPLVEELALLKCHLSPLFCCTVNFCGRLIRLPRVHLDHCVPLLFKPSLQGRLLIGRLLHAHSCTRLLLPREFLQRLLVHRRREPSLFILPFHVQLAL